jgi:hypothetical protein
MDLLMMPLCFRGEQVKLASECHEYAKKHRLFSMHLSSERSVSQQALKELVAHRHVLAAIAATNEKLSTSTDLQVTQHDDKYGRYGDGAFRYALLPQIEQEKARMEPSEKRKAKCKILLKKRRPMDVVSRTLSTPQILNHWTKKPEEPEPPEPVKPSPRVVGRLVVPPIQARPQHRTPSGDIKTILAPSHSRLPPRYRAKELSDVTHRSHGKDDPPTAATRAVSFGETPLRNDVTHNEVRRGNDVTKGDGARRGDGLNASADIVPDRKDNMDNVTITDTGTKTLDLHLNMNEDDDDDTLQNHDDDDNDDDDDANGGLGLEGIEEDVSPGFQPVFITHKQSLTHI